MWQVSRWGSLACRKGEAPPLGWTLSRWPRTDGRAARLAHSQGIRGHVPADLPPALPAPPDYAFSFVPGTWRWMLGIAALPSVVQLAGLLLLPESPRWLASRGRRAAAQAALSRLQPGATLAAAGIVAEGAASAGSGGAGSAVGGGPPWRLLLSRPVLRALHVGVGLQVLQQVAGINTVMYYTPTILQLAGAPKQAALLLALAPSATNALGTLVGGLARSGGLHCPSPPSAHECHACPTCATCASQQQRATIAMQVGLRLIDRYGRRRLLLSSIAAVVLALGALGLAFLAAERHSPPVQPSGGTCPTAGSPGGGMPGSCTACLRAGCGFCGGGGGDTMAAGTCLALDGAGQEAPFKGAHPECASPRQLFLHGCPR